MIYDLIFIFFYSLSKKNNRPMQRFRSIQIVMVFIFVHCFTIFCFVNDFIIHREMPKVPINSQIDLRAEVLLLYIIFTPIMMMIYNNNRIIKIQDKYIDTKIVSFKNALIIFLTFTIPFFLIVIMSNLRLKGTIF